MMDIAERLVNNVLVTTYESLPQEAIENTKNSILDTLGTILAGYTAPGCKAVVDLVREWGGKEESTILVFGGKVTAHNAAMVNSVMARALDYDNVISVGLHPSACSVPTALAIAEMRGHVSGKQLITAIAVGEDLATRLNLAVNPANKGFDPTGVCMALGTAAITGKLLGLKEEKMLSALGIAFNQAAGSPQGTMDGGLVVRVSQGLTSRVGIVSALLASKGITGIKNIMQGEFGFFRLFSQDQPNLEILTDQLGKRFENAKMACFKKHPSCGLTSSTIDGVLELINEHRFSPEEVERITVRVSTPVYTIVGHPFKVGSNSQVDAQFSISYTVASAIIRKSSKLEHFTEQYIIDPKVQEVASKVQAIADEELDKVPTEMKSMIMEIELKDGEKFSKFIRYPRGSPQNPMSNEEIKEKFRNCANYAPKLPTNRVCEKIISLIGRLEKVDDVCEIINLLTL